MTSEITEEMVERLVEQAAHLELGIACRGPDVSNAARELLSQLNAVLPGLRALAARPIEAGSVSLIAELQHAAYTEPEPTRSSLHLKAAAAIAEREERMKDLEDAILACEKGDALDVLANYRAVRRTIHATRAALQQEGESDV